MTWYYQDQEFTETPEEYEGFVYEIHDLMNDRLYIGQKKFWTKRSLPPLKGKTRRRHRRTASDWQEYYGSNTELLEWVRALGPNHFHREILILCANKNQMNYYEAKLQFERDVLLDSRYYNGIINCRVTSRGL